MEITETLFKFVGVNDCLTIWRTKMISTEEQIKLNEELLRDCEGYYSWQDKPDGAYIQVKSLFFNMNKIKRLIERGANVNAKDDFGHSPLRLAVNNDNVALAKLLISAGADVNAKDNDGRSRLYEATLFCHKEMQNLLEQHGAIE